jgi:2'-5' RNA ligase
MIRLFIALPLPHEVEVELDRLLVLLRPKGPDVKWVPAKNIHLTVKFLSETDEMLVPRIKAAMDETCAAYQPFESVIDQVSGFPNMKKPRVIWVGRTEPIEAAARMAAEIDRRMHELGFEEETRPFKAHLTLGRVREGRPIGVLATFLESFKFTPIPLTMDRLVLFQSTLTPKGSVYERLHEVKLGQERFGG